MQQAELTTNMQPFETLDMDKESFRKRGYEVIDAIADY